MEKRELKFSAIDYCVIWFLFVFLSVLRIDRHPGPSIYDYFSFIKECSHYLSNDPIIYEPRCEKTGFLHMRKQRRRSASR